MRAGAGALHELTLTELSRALRDGELSSRELTESLLQRIDEHQQQLTHGKLDVRYPTPIDEKTVLFIAEELLISEMWFFGADDSMRLDLFAVTLRRE